jgi:hypothetical protein
MKKPSGSQDVPKANGMSSIKMLNDVVLIHGKDVYKNLKENNMLNCYAFQEMKFLMWL